jgi:Tfp pilus assembly protein PilV
MWRRQIKDERGLTLIEVLVTLILSMMIFGILFSILTRSVQNFHFIEGHTTIRQEANIVLTELNTVHKKTAAYSLSVDSTTKLLKVTYSDATVTLIGNSKYIYTINNPPIEITKNHSFLDLNITIAPANDPTNRSKSYTINTIINRK